MPDPTEPIDPARMSRWTDTPQMTAEEPDEDDPEYIAGLSDGKAGAERARPNSSQYNLGYDNGRG